MTFAQQFILIVVMFFFYSLSTYYEHIASRMTGRFLARDAYPYFLISYLFLIIVGILLFWSLPIGERQFLNRGNILIATTAGALPLITVIGRICFRTFLSQSCVSMIMANFYLLQWMIVSSVPLIWLGMVMGWWLRGIVQWYRSSNG